jgi:hypothetical protein
VVQHLAIASPSLTAIEAPVAAPTHRPALPACLLAGLTALFAKAPAGAATITVTTTVDASAVACTLRDAITAANTDATSGACPAGAGNDTLDLTGLGGLTR